MKDYDYDEIRRCARIIDSVIGAYSFLKINYIYKQDDSNKKVYTYKFKL